MPAAAAAEFLDALRSADLEQYYLNFTMRGITTLDMLSSLPLQEYGKYGVVSSDDRKRLFALISLLKQTQSVLPEKSGSSGMSTPQQHYLNQQPVVQGRESPRQQSSGRSQSASRRVPTGPPIEAEESSGSRSFDLLNTEQTSSRPGSSFLSNRPKTTAAGLNAYGVPPGTSTGRTKSRNASSNDQLSKSESFSDISLNQTGERIKVCVRKRPLSSKELQRNERDITDIISSRSIQVNEPKVKVDLTKYIEKHQFVFDEVFDSESTNEQVYQRTAAPLVASIFSGGKATCFCYGQTGSGKTFTMLDPKQGLYMLASQDIFEYLRRAECQQEQMNAYVSFYEIYQGQLYDLLNDRKKLHAREDGNQNVIIQGIEEFEVHTPEDLMDVFDRGSLERSTGQTGANDDSSRSHAILQITIKKPAGGKTNKLKIVGKFSFIDLAGSERGADRGESDAKTRLEGSEINKSLLALKECIRALDMVSKHTPFRQSKLTQVLKDSFVGNSRTCMIATISPNSSNSEHTLNTLRYADRVKELKSDAPNIQISGMEEEDHNFGSQADFLIDEEFPGQQMISETDLDNSMELNQSMDELQLEEDGRRGKSKHERKTSILSNLNMNGTSKPTTATSTKSSRAQQNPPQALETPRRSLPDTSKHNMTQRPVELVETVRPAVKPSVTAGSRIPAPKSRLPNQEVSSPMEPTAPVPMEYTFTMEEVEMFVRKHRQQIRDITECCKEETQLLSTLTMQGLNKQNGDPTATLEHQLTFAFMDYVFALDGLLERKMRAMSDLRQVVKSMTVQSKRQSSKSH